MSSSKTLVSFVETESHSVCFQKLIDWGAIPDLGLREELEAGYSMEIYRTQLGSLEETIGIAAVEQSYGIAEVRFRAVRCDYQLLKVPSEGDLFCMIHAGKPLASFCIGLEEDENLMLAGQKFRKYIDYGMIETYDFYVESDGRALRQLLFFRKGQRWRAELMESLKRHLYVSSWSPHLEEIESYLLGYHELADNWIDACLEHNQSQRRVQNFD